MKSLKIKKKIKDTEALKNKEVKSLLEDLGLLNKNPKNLKSK